MVSYRITDHPIIETIEKEKITFYYQNKRFTAFRGEMISSALFANGIKIFGNHHKDKSAQGIFCANGQCSQCIVTANGIAVKSCTTEIKEEMLITPITKLPPIAIDDTPIKKTYPVPEFKPDVLIMGGGPAGLSAAIELASHGIKIIIADDKKILGGKLTLQTHNFFGSSKECYAGIRGTNIAKTLVEKIKKISNIKIWLNSPVVGVFSDKRIGVNKNGNYALVNPKIFLVAAGARERALAFPGCDLPGVYGAGAFQTLVNRDLIKPANKLFILGGGNVGLIAAYHALQAGINVIGLSEALPECGGYKVHLDKIKRLGIQVHTSNTILEAVGNNKVEKITTVKVDQNFKPLSGTEKQFKIDTLLIAVGLTPINEILIKAKKFGIKTYSAGDADVIAEASSAIFGGKIIGCQILKDMKYNIEIPTEWHNFAQILKSRPGKIINLKKKIETKNLIYPIIRCTQEIPCDPCVNACSKKSIKLSGKSIINLPSFSGECVGCGKCVAVCPGLAITLVDENYDTKKKTAKVIIPWELSDSRLKINDIKTTTGYEGEIIGKGKVIDIKNAKWQDKRKLVHMEVPFNDAQLIAGISICNPVKSKSVNNEYHSDEDIIICRCERVTKKQIVEKIKEGFRDINQLKAELRTGMGACGGKTCINLILNIFKEYGINPKTVEPHVYRPLELEVPLSSFINKEKDDS
jgi:sarcosine oxidase, subunit alpha